MVFTFRLPAWQHILGTSVGEGRDMYQIIFIIFLFIQSLWANACEENLPIDNIKENQESFTWYFFDEYGGWVYGPGRGFFDEYTPAKVPYEFSYWRIVGIPSCQEGDLCSAEYSRFYAVFYLDDLECPFHWDHWGDSIFHDFKEFDAGASIYEVLAPNHLIPEIQDSLKLHPFFYSFQYLDKDKFRDERSDVRREIMTSVPPFRVNLKLPLFKMSINQIEEKYPYLKGSLDELDMERYGNRDSLTDQFFPIFFNDTIALNQLLSEAVFTLASLGGHTPTPIIPSTISPSSYTLHESHIEIHESGRLRFYSMLGEVIESREVRSGDWIELPRDQRYIMRLE